MSGRAVIKPAQYNSDYRELSVLLRASFVLVVVFLLLSFQGCAQNSWTELASKDSQLQNADRKHSHDPRSIDELCKETTLADGKQRFELLPPINEFDLPPEATSGDIHPLSSLPLLHSRPGATQKIYLDFNGHTHTGIWGTNIVTPVYSTDGDLTTYDDTELANIEKIWRRVAEDYAPFDIDVTTEDPNDYAAKKAIRVCIGGSSTDWYGASAGGVAYVGSWRWAGDTPVYVFENNLGNGNEKYTAEAVSHEVGHAVGLYHQGEYNSSGVSIQNYYAGYGSGETGWAPIMGVGYYKNLTTFSNGEQPFPPASPQIDLPIVASVANGIAYRVDDHGSSNASAQPLIVTGDTSVSQSGVIEQNGDVDVFSFTTGAGSVTLAVAVSSLGPNLDSKLELYNSIGTLVSQNENATALNASLSLTLGEGMYFLHVKNNGSNARLGQYTVSGTIIKPTGGGSDTTPPTATLVSGSDTMTITTTSRDFVVRYSDNVAIERSSIGSNDLRVTGPLGFNQSAQLQSIDLSGNGTPRTATYRITGPTGGWQNAHNGSYSFQLQASAVVDTSGNAAPAGSLGGFTVNIAPPSVQYSISGQVTLAGVGMSGVSIQGGNLGVVTTDSNGNYTFSAIEQNTSYTLTPTREGYLFEPTSVTGSLTANTTRNFAASIQTYVVSGQVTLSSVPIAGVLIDGGSLGQTTTDGDGRYTFSGVNHGTGYQIVASKSGYAFSPLEYLGTAGNGNTGRKDFATACATGYQLNSGQCELAVSTPLAPDNIRATNGTLPDRVLVAWSAVPAAESYQVYRSTERWQSGSLLGVVSATTYDDLTASSETVYYYSVRAVNAAGIGALSPQDDGWRTEDLFSRDSDEDGVSDGQEQLDGTDPNDRGSGLEVLGQEVCFETNGFLGMLNIVEEVNMGSQNLQVSTWLVDNSGNQGFGLSYGLTPGSQIDLLVHDFQGRASDTIGRGCSRHNGNSGDLDGRMVYYRLKPGVSPAQIEFAFAMPFISVREGSQFQTFNTITPSLDPRDRGNMVANWGQVSNPNSIIATGSLVAYGLSGEELGKIPVTIDPQGRTDSGVHEFGQGMLGMVEWRPDDPNLGTQFRVVRYYYDNPGSVNSFDTAFQLEAARGTGSPLVVPLDTIGASAIVEIANTLPTAVSVTVDIYNESGQLLHHEQSPLAGRASIHVIADSYLTGRRGIAIIRSDTAESITAVAMHYGRTPTGGISYIYGVLGGQPIGIVQRSSYNNYLEQGCLLLLTNPTAADVVANISMQGAGQSVVLAGDQRVVPAHGLLAYDLCSKDRADRYGVVTVQTSRPSLYGIVLRLGAGDNYRLPTPLRR